MPCAVRYPAFVLVSVLLACGSGGGQFASNASKDTVETPERDGEREQEKDKEKETEKPAGETPKEEPAAADVPLIVSGAYLACADAESGAVSDLKENESAVGCRLADKKTDKTLALADLGSEWKWSVLPKPSDVVTVRVVDAPSGASQQSYYVFTGADAAKRKAFADRTVVILDGKLRTPVSGFKFFGTKIEDGKPGGSKATFTDSSGLPASDPPAPTPQKTPTFPAGQDRDGDAVPNERDKCNNTKNGLAVWTSGPWDGCAQGEFLDTDDGDLDGVANVNDRCIDTVYNTTVEATAGNARRGCAASQMPAP